MSWKITGIYKINNKINNEFYIGASVCIRSRYSTHMGRDVKKYKHTNRFYKEIYYYGKENFELEILEECNREMLLEREQFYYDKLKPTYNMIRPVKCSFTDPEVRRKSQLASQTPEKIAERKKLFNTEEYIDMFRKVHVDKMKPVEMISDGIVIKQFISMQEASRYITEITEFKGKNKTSKIKLVCDGERKKAFGYNWRYKNV